MWDHSSAGRAPALQAGGHRFEPYWSHIYADMAQLAEQLICNQQVIGSSPIVGLHFFCAAYGWIPERPKGADCKSVDFVFEGSNPSPSIYIDAGWSSLEARRAHNPKVVGSNPAPATKPR